MKTIPRPVKLLIAASILTMTALVHLGILAVGDAGQLEEDALTLILLLL